MIVDIVGALGVALVVLSYFFVQIEKLSPTDIVYPLLNIVGSGLILSTLYFNWNFASALIEGFWILVSGIGLYKCISKRGSQKVFSCKQSEP